MGNDGGSIPKRDDLVRTKVKDPRTAERLQQQLVSAYCALSKVSSLGSPRSLEPERTDHCEEQQPLVQPVVACPLGRLYNKEAVLAYLLSPDKSSESLTLLAHTKSLKDFLSLKLTPNPSPGSDKVEDFRAPFICPITMREMNGSVKFVARKPCGCVISDMARKETKEDSCPNCGDTSESVSWLTLNPPPDEQRQMAEEWERVKAARKAANANGKKGSKRKKGEDTDGNGPADPAIKKAKIHDEALLAPSGKQDAPAVKNGASIPKLSAQLAAKLEESKKHQSAAVASLYRKNGQDETRDASGRSTWMTRGTFTRYA